MGDAPERGELLRGARGERLRAEELDVGCHEAEAGRPIVGVVVRAGLTGGDLEHGVRVRGRGDRGSERLGHPVVLIEEEAAEDPVVGRDLLTPRDECRAPCPVEVDEVGGIERRHRLAVGDHVSRSDRDALGAQLVAERDEQVDEGRLSHQR